MIVGRALNVDGFGPGLPERSYVPERHRHFRFDLSDKTFVVRIVDHGLCPRILPDPTAIRGRQRHPTNESAMLFKTPGRGQGEPAGPLISDAACWRACPERHR